MFTKLKSSLTGFSREFWILISAVFIDTLGGYMLYPFWAFFVKDLFGANATQIGLVFTTFGVGSILGGILGGAISDKIGRKFAIIFGLITSALVGLIMPFFKSIEWFYVISIIAGILGGIGDPARSATLTDILPVEKRTEGFAIFRISFNLSATIGPLIGAFVLAAAGNYLILFILDSISSILCALIVFIKIPETKPQTESINNSNEDDNPINEPEEKKHKNSLLFTLRGYIDVLRDGKFIFFVITAALSTLVYQQMNASLPIFLYDEYGFTEKQFGYLLGLNGLMVITLQYFVSRVTSKFPTFIVLAVAALLNAIGFGIYGFTTETWVFYIAMVIITLGELIGSPHGASVIGLFSPDDKRGRYSAISSLSWMVPSLFGYVLAGFIMVNFNPNLVWWIMGIVGVFATGGYMILHKLTKKRFSTLLDEHSDNKI